MKVLGVLVRLHWGFSVRYPHASAFQQSFPAPPPSTLVGSLAAACTRGVEAEVVEGVAVSGAFRVAEKVNWAAAGWLDHYVEAASLMRYFTGPYQSRKTLLEKGRGLRVGDLFAPVGVGYVFSVAGRLLLTFWGDGVESFKDCAWHIHRVGSRESVVAVEEVEVADVKAEKEGRSYVYVPRPGASVRGLYRSLYLHMRRGNGGYSWFCTYALAPVARCVEEVVEAALPAPGMYLEVWAEDLYVGEVLGFDVAARRSYFYA